MKSHLLAALISSVLTTWKIGISVRLNFLGWVFDRYQPLTCPPSHRTGSPLNEKDMNEYIQKMRYRSVAMASIGKYIIPTPPIAKMVDTKFKNRDGIDIGVRIHYPLIDNSKKSNKNGSLPVIVFFHGGGFVTASPELYDPPCRRICSYTNCVVVSPDYRLAPETTFPGAHHDCLDSLRWVISNCEKLGVDPNRIIIAGDSAGGNLCASIGVMAANENIQIRCLVMIYPMTTMTYDILSLDENGDGLLKPGQVKPPSPFYSWIENASGPFLQTVDIQWCGSLYAKDESAILDPRLSVILTPLDQLKRLPPTLLITATHDPLRDEGMALLYRLRKAGVNVKHYQMEGHFHGLLNFELPSFIPGFFETIGEFTSSHLALQSKL